MIRHYAVNVTAEETGQTTHHTTDSEQIVIQDRHPYYIYNCTVAAVTVGPGPHDTIGVRTREAGTV